MAKKIPTTAAHIMMAFDTETTGLIDNASTRLDLQPEVIEFTGIIFDAANGNQLEELSLLFRPSKMPLPPKITSITGITDADLADAPPFPTLLPHVVKFIARQPRIVAHNLSYDMEVLDLEMKRHGRPPIEWPRGVCTVEQTIHLRGYRLSLQELHKELFGEHFTGAHRARADVQALIRCCVELRRRELI